VPGWASTASKSPPGTCASVPVRRAGRPRVDDTEVSAGRSAVRAWNLDAVLVGRRVGGDQALLFEGLEPGDVLWLERGHGRGVTDTSPPLRTRALRPGRFRFMPRPVAGRRWPSRRRRCKRSPAACADPRAPASARGRWCHGAFMIVLHEWPLRNEPPAIKRRAPHRTGSRMPTSSGCRRRRPAVEDTE